jgi:hypothetical protein
MRRQCPAAAVRRSYDGSLSAARQDDAAAHHLGPRRARIETARVGDRVGRPVARRREVDLVPVVAKDGGDRIAEQA